MGAGVSVRDVGMKILLTHRYFWPDSPPYAAMLRRLAGDMAAKGGRDVHVFASMPSYRSTARVPRREVIDGVQVARCRVLGNERAHMIVRVLNTVVYCTGLFFHILRKRPDVVTAATFPPVVAGWTASLAARLVGAKFVYHMQDVHPEVSEISGGRMGRGLALRLFRWLDNQTLRRAAAIVVLSEDLANTVRARGLGDLPIHVINNFPLDTGGAPEAPPAELVKPDGVRRVIFAGNLGRFQNLDALAEGVMQALEDHPDTQLMFLGDGDALAGLKARWGDHPRVIFGPFLPFAQAGPLIGGADVGLVSLAPEIYRVSYPSKIFTYVALGLPILMFAESDSAMARHIRDAGIGTVPRDASAPEIAAALSALLADLDRHKAATRVFAEEFASFDAVAARWDRMLTGLDPATPAPG